MGGHRRHHHRAGHRRDARKPGDGRGGNAEKRHEHRIAFAEVHVRQVIKRQPFFDRFRHRPDAVLPRVQFGRAQSRAAVQQHRVEYRIFLFAVHRHQRKFRGQPDAAHVESDKMRRQPDHRPLAYRKPVLQALDTHHAQHAFAAAPPQDAVLEQAAREYRKVIARKLHPLLFAQIGKTQPQIGQHHAPPFSRQRIQQQARGTAQRRQQRQRQPVQQPDQPESEARHHAAAAGGSAPAGTL